MKNRGLSIGCIALVVAAVGCASPKSSNPSVEALQQPGSLSVAQRVLPETAQSDDTFNVPDALARKALDFSREVEPHLTKLGSGAAAEPSPPSQVVWSDPSELHLGNRPSAAPAVNRDSPPMQPAAIQTAPGEANVVADAETSAEAARPGTESNAVTAAANAPAPAEQLPLNVEPITPAPAGGQLAAKLAARIRDYPRDVSSHLEFQLLQFLLDEQVPQLSALASLPGEDRELITAVLDGLTLFRSTLRSDNNMLLSAKIRPLVEMSNRLKSQADLTIPTVTLCRSVGGFGKYEPIEPARFTAGLEHRAILYCEVANFSSILNHQRLWETQLKQELVLYTELFGAAVWEDKSETIIDTARNRRHDFFVNKRIVIPGNLAVGRYLLKVSIIDLHANRVAEASVPIVIVAQ